MLLTYQNNARLDYLMVELAGKIRETFLFQGNHVVGSLRLMSVEQSNDNVLPL